MIQESDLERTPVQLVVREAVAFAMETPLREPILDAVERTAGERTAAASVEGESEPSTGETESATTEGESSGGSTLTRGLVTFVVTFVVLYAVLRRFTGGE